MYNYVRHEEINEQVVTLTKSEMHVVLIMVYGAFSFFLYSLSRLSTLA